MSSATIGFLLVSVIGCCIDDPLFSLALLLAFVYATMILIPEHAQNRYTMGEGR